jgi:hypothetical protein
MSAGRVLPQDCPDRCRAVVATAEAEHHTLVDAVLTGDLDLGDLEVFLQYTTTSDHDIDAGLVRIVEIIHELLQQHE